MRIILIIFTILLVLFVSTTDTFSQENKLRDGSSATNTQIIGVPSEINSMNNTFFDLLKKNKLKEAYDVILKNSPLMDKKESVENLISQTKKSFKLYGNFKGYESINFEYVSESYLRIRFLGLHTKYPTRWVITYYKSPETGWFVTNIKFDDLSEFFFLDK